MSKKRVKAINVDEFLSGGKKPKNAKVNTEEIKTDSKEEEMDVEIDQHKKELQALKQSDPEFYEHLMQSEKDLLDFGNEDEIEGDSENEMEEEEEEEEEKAKKQESFTIEDIIKIEELAMEGQFPSLRKLLKIVRTGCASLAEPKSVSKGKHSNNDSETNSALFAPAFDHVVKFCLKHMHEILELHAPKDKKDMSVNTNSNTWKKMGPYVKSYINNMLAFGATLVEENIQRSIIAHFSRIVSYFKPFSKAQQKLVKLLLEWFGSGEEFVRIDSFLLLRTMALGFSSSMLDFILKHSYLTYARNCKAYNKNSAGTIQLLSNCVVELFSLNPQSSYQFIFVYLRQLAIHLRQAILSKTAEAVSGVYNWQFMNCMRLIASLLSNHCKTDSEADASSSPLFPLVYPFIQICIGVLEFVPTSRYFPLRFLCVKLLNQVSEAAGVYVPVAVHLLPVLQASQLDKKAEHLIKGQFSAFEYSLHASKTALVSKFYQEYCFTEMSKLFLQHFVIYSYSVSFPELIVPTILQLKKFIKSTKIMRFSKMVQNIVQQLESSATWSRQKRSSLDVVPKNVTSINFLKQCGTSPLAQYSALLASMYVNSNYILFTENETVQEKVEVKSLKTLEEEEIILNEKSKDKTESSDKSTISKKKKVKGKKPVENKTEDDIVEDFELSDDDNGGDDWSAQTF